MSPLTIGEVFEEVEVDHALGRPPCARPPANIFGCRAFIGKVMQGNHMSPGAGCPATEVAGWNDAKPACAGYKLRQKESAQADFASLLPAALAARHLNAIALPLRCPLYRLNLITLIYSSTTSPKPTMSYTRSILRGREESVTSDGAAFYPELTPGQKENTWTLLL